MLLEEEMGMRTPCILERCWNIAGEANGLCDVWDVFDIGSDCVLMKLKARSRLSLLLIMASLSASSSDAVEGLLLLQLRGRVLRTSTSPPSIRVLARM